MQNYVLPRRLAMAVAVTAVLSAATGLSAQAQETGARMAALEEVIVTAQRRQESLQDVPIAVVAMSSDDLAQRGIDATIGLPEAVPSVQLTRSGPSGIFFVRGVGNTSGGVGEEGANAFYVDGVFMPDLSQSVLRFNNIERIEVLKGPQGTLFGRNASGGLVHVITREPGQETVADIRLGYANYDTTNAQAYVAGPLADNLAADLAITIADQGEGWGRNHLTGSHTGKGWHWGVRSKWVWEPTDRSKITLSGEYMKLADDTASTYHVAPGSVGVGGVVAPGGDGYDTVTNDPNSVHQEVYGLNLTAEFDLGWASLTSLSAMRNLEMRSQLDPDAGPIPMFGIDLNVETEAFQQEFRLASHEVDPFSWQVGLFYLHSTAEQLPQVSRGLALAPLDRLESYAKQTTDSYAAFGEVGYAIRPTTHVTAGLRYTRDDKDFSGRQVGLIGSTPASVLARKDSTSDEEVTWRLSIRQDITDNINVYASYNRGFKSGVYALNAYPWDPVDPQTIDAYEIGMKAELLDSRLRLNLAAFYYEIDDYQVRAATGPGATTLLLNAASVDVEGFEIEFEAVPLEGLTVFGSGTFLKSEFSSFPFAPYTYPNPAVCTPTGSAPGMSIGAPTGGAHTCLGSASGNDTPLAPRFAGTLGATYAFPVGPAGELRLSAMYSYNDGYYFEIDNRLKQPSYGILNTSVAYHPDQHWGIEFWTRNLTNDRYYVQKLGSALADLAVQAAPRTYGVNLSYSY